MNAPEPAPRPMARHEASYELVSHLASGGMAELFIARRHGDDDAPYVVLKRVVPEQARNPHFVGMFLDEARLAARLHHPNIAAVLDVGRAGSSYYYTMEYVHGENVRDLLQLAVKRRVMVPLDVCLAILVGAATGLHAAHETRDRRGEPLGIVHRDVSPSNVMIGYDGQIKLVDFGVAKAADHTTETQSGTVKGKIAYLSPEQCTVQPVDRRSDVFSLGIVGYELLTRSRLFRRRSDYETMHAIVNAPVPPPSQARPEVPPAIDRLILRALSRDPAARPQSAAELADEVRAVADQLGLATGPAVLAAAMAELFGTKPLPWAHLEHQDTAVISLAALAPGVAAGEPDPFERSVSEVEVAIEVDQALSSSVDQAFAQVKTAIAVPPREWGVGEEEPGVFTWPSRDEGVEALDRTEMTASPRLAGRRLDPLRRTDRGPPPAAVPPPGVAPLPSAGAFSAADTIVTPPEEIEARIAAFLPSRTATGAAPAPAPTRRPTAPPVVERAATAPGATTAPGERTATSTATATAVTSSSTASDRTSPATPSATAIERAVAAATQGGAVTTTAPAAPTTSAPPGPTSAITATTVTTVAATAAPRPAPGELVAMAERTGPTLPALSSLARDAAPQDGEAAATFQFGKVAWLDELPTTLSDRAAVQRRMATRLAQGTPADAVVPPARPTTASPARPATAAPPSRPTSTGDAAVRTGARADASGPVARAEHTGPTTRAELRGPTARAGLGATIDATVEDMLAPPGDAAVDLDATLDLLRDSARTPAVEPASDPLDHRTTTPRAATRPPPEPPPVPPRPLAAERSGPLAARAGDAIDRPGPMVPARRAAPTSPPAVASPAMPLAMSPPPGSHPGMLPPPAAMMPPVAPSWSPHDPRAMYQTGPGPLARGTLPPPEPGRLRRAALVIMLGALVGGGLAVAVASAL